MKVKTSFAAAAGIAITPAPTPQDAVPSSTSWLRQFSVLAIGISAVVTGCGGGDDAPVAAAPPPPVTEAPPLMTCSEDPAVPTSIKTLFEKENPDTKVLAVREFKVGDSIRMNETATSSGTATKGLCLVKLLVGPGTSDLAGQPSDTQGIGIQVWMPTPGDWNERIRSYGNGGWAGTAEASLTTISGPGCCGPATHIAAANKGYLVTTSDNGVVTKTGRPAAPSGFMRSDGSINTPLWEDFSWRSLHETAVKAKALALRYYGKPQKFAYYDGYSTGGRQGMKLAQVAPEDYDAILAGAPSVNWTNLLPSLLYPSLLTIQTYGQTGTSIPAAKGTLVNNAAIAQCKPAGMYGDMNLLTKPSSCHYDPTRDAAVLCAGVTGNYGVTGTSADANCVNLQEATLMNKMWYGQTIDGTAPDPALDNGQSPFLSTLNKQLWFGYPRSVTPLSQATGSNGNVGFGPEQTALNLQNASYASTSFTNLLGNGQRNWRFLTVSDLYVVTQRGKELDDQFGKISSDNPDLSAFKARGGKIIHYHGVVDNLVMVNGSINYYNRVAHFMSGGTGSSGIESFYRLFTIPGMPHQGIMNRDGAGSGTLPLPETVEGKDQLFEALVKWREQDIAPAQIVVSSGRAATTQRSVPLCPYPTTAVYNGTGDVNASASYSCN
jgi:hypothetical protein